MPNFSPVCTSYAQDERRSQPCGYGSTRPQTTFGLVDADGTGQDNLFKYLAGLDPLDPAARFVLSIAPVAGQPTQRALIFSPVYGGRTYTVQTTSSLTQPNWTALNGATVVVNGTTETVTDPDVTGRWCESGHRFDPLVRWKLFGRFPAAIAGGCTR